MYVYQKQIENLKSTMTKFFFCTMGINMYSDDVIIDFEPKRGHIHFTQFCYFYLSLINYH